MNRSLIWREWQEMASSVTWAFAALVFGVVTTRFIDDAMGVTITGAVLGMILGNAMTASERSVRVREFLLTRPANRARLIRVKLLLAFGLLNLTMGAVVLCIALDLPRAVYGLVAETTLGRRLISVDAPIVYPAAFAYANCVLALVLHRRLFARNPGLGTVLALILSVATGMAAARLFSMWPHRFGALAFGFAAVFVIAALVLVIRIRHRFAAMEVSGGGA